VLNNAAASGAFNAINRTGTQPTRKGEQQMAIKNGSAAMVGPYLSKYDSNCASTSAVTSAMSYAAASTNFVNSQPSALPPAAFSDDALPLNTFLKELHREERRSERSGRALSLVIYRFDDSTALGQATADKLLKAIYATKRETDVVGHIAGQASVGIHGHFSAASAGRAAGSTVALLCPDTAAAGLSCLQAKVSKLAGPLWCNVTAATYPDDLFLSLSAGLPMPSAFASLHAVEPSALVEAAVGEPQGGEYRFKRALDILGASFLLLVLALPMLLVAAAVAFTSSGSPIFKQTRVGKGGVPFTFYKFRSMVVDSDDRIHREFVSSLIKGDGSLSATASATSDHQATFYKLKTDPRVTPLGRFLRKTSIDELPQLFNVLKGDMSLVGPRPPIPYESAQYQPWHLRRILAIKPGITGLWQVAGRSHVGFSDMVRMDLRYLRDCSFGLDVKILWKTVGAVIRCDGAA
jgi:lipopolysaccharide/colanic/teichoic acid biosynthesis glycosyltransferase